MTQERTPDQLVEQLVAKVEALSMTNIVAYAVNRAKTYGWTPPAGSTGKESEPESRDAAIAADNAFLAGLRTALQQAYGFGYIEGFDAGQETYRTAFNEWTDKTAWLRPTLKPAELGKHLADVLRERIEALETTPPAPAAAPNWEAAAREMAVKIAGNCNSAPQLVFPYLYLGLKDLFAAAPAQAVAVPIELQGVQEAVEQGSGFWRSCTGCHELNEGHDTGPVSKVFGCALGNGCSECGGIGAVWDDLDYGAMAVAMVAPAQEHATQLAGQGQLTWDALRALAIKHGAWVSGYGPFATELLATYGRAPEVQPHWVAKWLAAAGAARAAPAQAQEDARDAARYRWLREEHEGGAESLCVFGPNDMRECLVPIGSLPGELDAFIDAARAAQGGAA